MASHDTRYPLGICEAKWFEVLWSISDTYALTLSLQITKVLVHQGVSIGYPGCRPKHIISQNNTEYRGIEADRQGRAHPANNPDASRICIMTPLRKKISREDEATFLLRVTGLCVIY